MDFKHAIETLQNAGPENILLQLLDINRAIQNADDKEILAIHHTLKGADEATPSTSPAWRQIKELQKSVVSRMISMVVSAKEPKRAYAIFNAVLGYEPKLNDAYERILE